MAFKTGLPLDDALRNAINTAVACKNQHQQFAQKLAGSISANDALQFANFLRTIIPQLQQCAAVPGIQAFAQAQYSDSTYDVGTEFTTMMSAIQSVLTWLENNIPSNAVSVTSAKVTYSSFTPAQTAPLLTLVNDVVATIN